MMQQTTHTTYRFARPEDRMPAGRVADIQFGPAADEVTVLVMPGHATARLLAEFTTQQEANFATGQWERLEPTPENLNHPRRVHHARWRLTPAHEMPSARILMSVEERGHHAWLVREGEATAALERDMNLLLADLLQSGVYIQRGAGDDTGPDDS
jgi:mannosyltransferase OCH1-like enzyme